MPFGRRCAPAAIAAALSLAAAASATAADADAGPPIAATGASAPARPPFEDEIRGFEAADRKAPPRHRPAVVFIGSSSIRMWQTLEKDFPRHRVLNRGFGGSQIADSVRYADRILLPHKPALVVMYAGSNDINDGKTPATVAADFQAFTAKVWSQLPGTQIAFISIAPNPARFAQVERVREANRLIAAACAADQRLRFVDVFPLMLGEDGRPRRELFIDDGLHMNRKGYELWIPVVSPLLDAVTPAARTSTRRARVE